jgi:hypothetical protein
VFLVGYIVPLSLTSVTGQVNEINGISVLVLDTNFLWVEGMHTLMEVQAMALVTELLTLCLAGFHISQHKQINCINGPTYSGQYLLFDIPYILDS